MTTIKMNRIANITAIGHHGHKNSKPVVRLAPFAIYASALDAGEANNVTVSAISLVCNGKSKSCKGQCFCWLSDLFEHLDEINEHINAQNAKAEAYDALIAKQKAEKEAKERAIKHKAKCDKLEEAIAKKIRQLEKEKQLLAEAERLCSVTNKKEELNMDNENNVTLVGFVHQYGENDFSLWGVQLSEGDERAINEILQKYEARGVSIRGDTTISIEEIM